MWIPLQSPLLKNSFIYYIQLCDIIAKCALMNIKKIIQLSCDSKAVKLHIIISLFLYSKNSF